MSNRDTTFVLYPKVTYDGNKVLFDGEHRATFEEVEGQHGFITIRLVDVKTNLAVEVLHTGGRGYAAWMKARDRGQMVNTALWRGYFRNEQKEDAQ